MRKINSLIFFVTCLICTQILNGQVTDRLRPAEWNNLVFGGRFMDRFLPMPDLGPLTRDTWGADNVLPRDIKNGIENMLKDMLKDNDIIVEALNA